MTNLDMMVYPGGELKLAGQNGDLVTIAGDAVLYDERGTTARDFAGDYFTKESDLGHLRGNGVDATFHHGFAVADTAFALGLADHKFSHPWRTEDDGDRALVASIVLDMRNEYEAFVREQAEQGLLSLSTGAVGHKVKRLPDGWLKRWWIGEISPTPTPAEPRLAALSLKSLIADAALRSGEIDPEEYDRLKRAIRLSNLELQFHLTR